MNKKIIIGIITLILVIGIAVGIYFLTNKPTKSTTHVENKITGETKTLVLYFSWSGNTEKMANEIADYTDADIERIVETDTYTSDYDTLTDIALEEQRNNERPKYNKLEANLEEYDEIFVGYPIWWMDMPQILYTVLENENFEGKTVIPFITSYSSGESGTTNKIRDILTKSEIKDALHIYDRDIDDYKETTDEWLNKLGY